MPAHPTATLAADAQAIVDRVVQRFQTTDATARYAGIWLPDPTGLFPLARFVGNVLVRICVTDAAGNAGWWTGGHGFVQNAGVLTMVGANLQVLAGAEAGVINGCTVNTQSAGQGVAVTVTGLAGTTLDWLVDMQVDCFRQ